MATAGFYRRLLPSPPAVDFASSEGKQLFAEALADGTMEGFFKLISYYQTQSEPAYCGLATLAVVLNALAIDPGRTWKGPWRWFDDSMLDCCEPLEKIKTDGITFGKVACLAVCNGAKVRAFRADESTIDEFRKHVISCASSMDCHVIVSYHRAAFKQTGTGHFSPIGGYHAGRDMVLILDVARFKYPPHWVPLNLLWEGMNTIDKVSGQLRGFMIMSRPSRAPSVLFTLSCRHDGWKTTAKYLTEDVPSLITSEFIKDVKDVVSTIFKSVPADFEKFMEWVAEVRRPEDGSVALSEEEKGRLALKGAVLKQIRESELFRHVTSWLASEFSELLAGKINCNNGFCCMETNVEHLNSDCEKTVTVVSGTVITDGTKQRVDMLIPLSQTCNVYQKNCGQMYPCVGDVLTVLLLALPEHTWSGIKEKKLQEQVKSLISIDSLPPLLEEEVLHLRRQLRLLVSECCASSCPAS